MIKNYIITFLFGFVIGLIINIVIGYYIPEYTTLYKMGQVDAINGKIQYQLKTNPDNTREWIKK